MPIPESVLAHVDANAPSVINYRREICAPMVQPPPAAPAQGDRPIRCEGPRIRGRRVRVTGAPGSGVLRVSHERGIGAGGALVLCASTTQRQRTELPQTPSHQSQEVGPSTTLQEVPVTTDPIIDQDPNIDTTYTRSRSTARLESTDVETSDIEFDTYAAIRESLNPRHADPRPPGPGEESKTSSSSSSSDPKDSEPSMGDMRRTEG